MPLNNWIGCVNGDLKNCRINKKIGNHLNDEIAWDIIYDSYINQMGLDKNYTAILKIMKEKALIECDFVTSNDRFKLTLLEIEERKLQDMIKDSNGGTIAQSLIYLSKWLGSWLNPNNMTAKEYFTLLNEMEKINKNS